MTKYSHSSLCHAMLFCNQNMVVLLIHLALTKYYCCSNETMCWHFDKKAQEQIFEDNPVWFEISGMGVMGRFTRPLPLPAPLELPAPYPILPLPDWGLVLTFVIFPCEHFSMQYLPPGGLGRSSQSFFRHDGGVGANHFYDFCKFLRPNGTPGGWKVS